MKALKAMKFTASPQQRRWMVLGSALAIVVAAGLWPVPQEEEPARPAQSVARGQAPGNAGAPAAQPGQPEQRGQEAPASASPAAAPAPGTLPGTPSTPPDIFAARTWEPPPPPPDLTPPPPPKAPPLPFRFIGRISEPGKRPAFLLAQGEEVLTVRVGDVIDRDWRLEKFTGGKLKFRYRPLNLLSNLPIGDGDEP